MPGLLNQTVDFTEVRRAINRRISYDAKLSFSGTPQKILLTRRTKLFRMTGLANGRHFEGVWWMTNSAFEKLKQTTNEASHGTGRMLRNLIAEKMAIERADYQTTVVEIELTTDVYGWQGLASPIFNRPGGMMQIFLPNLAERGNTRFSPYAKTRFTHNLKL